MSTITPPPLPQTGGAAGRLASPGETAGERGVPPETPPPPLPKSPLPLPLPTPTLFLLLTGSFLAMEALALPAATSARRRRFGGPVLFFGLYTHSCPSLRHLEGMAIGRARGRCVLGFRAPVAAPSVCDHVLDIGTALSEIYLVSYDCLHVDINTIPPPSAGFFLACLSFCFSRFHVLCAMGLSHVPKGDNGASHAHHRQ